MSRIRLLLLSLVVFAAMPGSAFAATVSGTLPTTGGFQLIVLEANGRGTLAAPKPNGNFSLKVRTLNGASVQLVARNGRYFGPVLFGGSGSTVYGTIRGNGNLKLGRVAIRNGYGVAILPNKRTMRSAGYAVAAVNGRPIGAGNYGRVLVGGGSGPLKGFNGPGRDADLDGIPGLFDVDDNGNLILDNVDRTDRKGKGRPPKAGAARQVIPGATEFRITSQYQLSGTQTPNVGAIGTRAANGVAGALFPTAFALATGVIGGGTANLNCLGDVYCLVNSLGTPPVAYPQVNGAPVFETTDGIVPIVNQPSGVASILPGATLRGPRQAAGGDAFLQQVGRAGYPGILNFAIATSPALQSYAVGTAAPFTLAYQSDGTANHAMDQNNGNGRIQVSASSSRVTLTFWRPQRLALPGEPSAGGWVDIGGLVYSIDTAPAPTGGGTAGCAAGAYFDFETSSSADSPIQNPDGDRIGMLDVAKDAPANSRNTLSMTVDLAQCYSWNSIPAGTLFRIGLRGTSLWGDTSERALYIRKNT